MAKNDKIPESEQGSVGETGAEQKVDVQQAQRIEPNPPSKEIDKDARMWAMFCHLGGLAMFIPILPVIGNVIAPLIIWQIKKDDYPFVNEQGKEAVNFQISMLIYGLVSAILIVACIGTVLLPAVVIVDVVFLLIAAVKANDGHHYRYPLTIRFIK
jgi:uncharacterized Tic20 family protein